MWMLWVVILLPVCLVIGVLILNFLVIGSTWARIHSLKTVPHRRVGLVLGTNPLHNGRGRPNPLFWNRLDAAEALFRAGKVDQLLVSGDNYSIWNTESQVMHDALVARGIPADLITMDFAGLRTLDSLVRARDVFGHGALTVISQRGHVQRAVFIGRFYGIDAVAMVADPPEEGTPWQIYYRECLAKVKAVLDLYVLKTPPAFPREIRPERQEPGQ